MKGKVLSVGAIVLFAVALFGVTSASAQSVAGRWTAKAPGAQGESDITLVLKVDGSTVTGTLNNSQVPGDVEIKEGKVTGDEVSFSLMRTIGQQEMKVLWKGKVAGDEIKFTRSTEGGAAGGAGGAPTEIVARSAM
jgi:hypothetical protein